MLAELEHLEESLAREEAMPSPFVHLYEHVGTGVIIEHPTGVTYSNQAGGTSCLQPSLEGAFVPIRNDVLLKDSRFVSPETDLLKYFAGLL